MCQSATVYLQVKLFDTNSGALSALSGTGIEVMVAAPNAEIPNLAANVSYASSWLAANVKPYLGVGFLPGANITYVSALAYFFLASSCSNVSLV